VAIPPWAAGGPGAGGLARRPRRVSRRARAPRRPRRVQPRADAPVRSLPAGPRSGLWATPARDMRSPHACASRIAQGVLFAPRRQRARSALTSWSCRRSERRGVVREGAPARSLPYQERGGLTQVSDHTDGRSERSGPSGREDRAEVLLEARLTAPEGCGLRPRICRCRDHPLAIHHDQQRAGNRHTRQVSQVAVDRE